MTGSGRPWATPSANSLSGCSEMKRLLILGSFVALGVALSATGPLLVVLLPVLFILLALLVGIVALCIVLAYLVTGEIKFVLWVTRPLRNRR